MVYIVDPKQRVDGREWRLSFDLNAFSLDQNGNKLRDIEWMPKVVHVLHVLTTILGEFSAVHDQQNNSCMPVFARKADDDAITVGLYDRPCNPTYKHLEVSGWRVEWFDVPDGAQCAMGFDEKLMVIDDLSVWPK